MAEAIMNRKGRGNFTAFSAGSHPTGAVRPEALRQIEKAGLSTTEARSKSWDEFSKPDSPPQFCVHCLRQRRERGLSILARTADDGSLGNPLAGRSDGNPRRDRPGLQPGVPST
jgi:hypothetical protein